MAALAFDDIIQSHYIKNQALVTWREWDHTWRGRLEHTIKQIRVWKIAWSLDDLRTLGFGLHLVVQGLGKAILSIGLGKANIDLFLEMVDLEIRSYGRSKGASGLPERSQDEDYSSCQLQGKIANSYTLVRVNDNCVASSLLSMGFSLLTCESNYSLPLVDDVHVVSVDTLVDPIDDEIDFSCKINLCPPTIEANMLNESTSSCVIGVDQLMCETYSPLGVMCDVLNRTQIPSKDGNLFLKDESTLKGKGCVVLETTSPFTLCDFIVESTHGDECETSSNYTHKGTLVEVNLIDSFLYSLFALDDMYAIIESMPFCLGGDHGKRECCLDPCLWTLFPFDPGAKCRNSKVGAPNLLLGLYDKQNVTLGESHNETLCTSFIKFLIFHSKDPWLYFKYVPPWHDDVYYYPNPNPHAMRMLFLFVLSLVSQGLGKAILSIGLGKANIDLFLEMVDLEGDGTAFDAQEFWESAIFLAKDIAVESKDSQDEFLDRISRDDYMKYAVEECYYAIKFVLTSILDDERNDEGKKWVERIYEDIRGSITKRSINVDVDMNKLPLVIQKVTSLMGILIKDIAVRVSGAYKC
ncbi:hypothetical protein FXO38_22542 [Capsicum annuum]|nr:hypothetical protein FXO37_29064 [Capsicum annuum]KAF3639645.1 hypothetical protein FXO38_22542 [Capsicum annuum]